MVQTKEISVLICDATDAQAERSVGVVAGHAEVGVEAAGVQAVTEDTISAAAPVPPVRANVAGRASQVVAGAGSGEEDGPLGGTGVVGAEQVAGSVGTLPGAAGV